MEIIEVNHSGRQSKYTDIQFGHTKIELQFVLGPNKYFLRISNNDKVLIQSFDESEYIILLDTLFQFHESTKD